MQLLLDTLEDNLGAELDRSCGPAQIMDDHAEEAVPELDLVLQPRYLLVQVDGQGLVVLHLHVLLIDGGKRSLRNLIISHKTQRARLPLRGCYQKLSAAILATTLPLAPAALSPGGTRLVTQLRRAPPLLMGFLAAQAEKGGLV